MRQVVVTKSQRTPNEVDRLQEKIQSLRDGCEHDFRLLRKVKLPESKVKGIFILGSHHGEVDECILRCLHCSQTKSLDLLKTCPWCLEKLKAGQIEGYGSREKYFGQKHLYYSAKRYTCKSCNFIGVTDEWDQ
ncbi:MAG: hypothetical protein A3B25_02565 [Candidatus Ryanbacteria bacterium RIFCSPLOWO2_01_FULL_48_26]|uniref:Uncharacterized protein n=1 Tax=Candidatus Ryanbacteria bacterium RIFCSPLOWO2_01_FULL_48_26 TaxID=1802126 RepID=A0A1G2GVR6_9BACT|nr:MAG: hypothetical protein A3B25_02565 [Candidatus Ryanbacteria bacterium RIFCSPLOWO2_01_FULL_48_26]